MQYDRNDEIIYDEGFTSSSEKEYYRQDFNEEYNTEDKSVKREKRKSFPSVLFFQIIICVLCGLFLFFSKQYAPDFFNDVMDKVSDLINDSLIVEGKDVNDYFVIKD